MDKEKNKNNSKRKKNRKTIIMIVVIAIVILAIAISTIFVLNYLKNKDKDTVIIDGTDTLKNVTGRLADYINNLGNNYYIRYMGQFGTSSLNQDLVDATVEFSKRGAETAIYSETLKMNVITDGIYAYNILTSREMIIRVDLPIKYNTEAYNLISDFGQIYVADVSTKVAGVDYIYQEYKYGESKIRYYFVGTELRYIRVLEGETDRKINIRVDRHTKEELFNMPKNYSLHTV